MSSSSTAAAASIQITATPQEQSKFTINCWNGMMDDIYDTLAKHPDAVHWRHTDTNNTGLTYAVAHGSHKYDVAVLMLDNRADINAQNNDGMTALMLAAEGGSEAYVELLLSRGADQTLQNKKGQTAEDIAVASGRASVAGEFDKHRARELRHIQEVAEAAARAKQQEMDAEIASIHMGTTKPLQVRRPLTFTPKRG